jgi:hypothetical protein
MPAWTRKIYPCPQQNLWKGKLVKENVLTVHIREAKLICVRGYSYIHAAVCRMARFWGEVWGGAHLPWDRFTPPLRVFAPPLKSHAPPLGKVSKIDRSEKLTFFCCSRSTLLDVNGRHLGFTFLIDRMTFLLSRWSRVRILANQRSERVVRIEIHFDVFSQLYFSSFFMKLVEIL